MFIELNSKTVKHFYEGKNRRLEFIYNLCFINIIRILNANVCEVYFELFLK